MRIEKALINDRLRVSKVYENFTFQLFTVLQLFTRHFFFNFFFPKQIYTKVQSPTKIEINKYIYKKNIETNKTNKKSPSHPPSVLFSMYY